ncbi:MAG: hypothetical protein BA870_02595 [Desulfuromonadales bacterium C00003094]|jgi:hypothetical protein|nr:MAG: hypothetical protein BA870_02595 [Desulfuromonadales bacterium C00003094]OEU72340.1 MAG: hypothetical protein BA869_00195 [Desulfuromonadales bacterium C00003107]
MACIGEQSLDHCTCTYAACDKRGRCCECVVYHRDKGEVPGCFFSAAGERSYDRSLKKLCEDGGC